MFALSKAANLNQLVQGGQLYRAFPFSKVSLPQPTRLARKIYLTNLKKLCRYKHSSLFCLFVH
jgi:hypothetical protein